MGSGWAYVGLPDTAGAQGPDGSVQYHTGSGGLSGSAAFVVTNVDPFGTTSRVAISGTLTVDGIISASHFHIENVTEVDSTGSTCFGNTNDDLHARTGSLGVSSLSTIILYATASADAATPYVGIGTTAPTVTLDVAGDLKVDGDTTLGDASGDTVTINAQTINPANIAAGADNSVVVYNGSTLLTDEIDSRVWGSTLVDYTGTPTNNQLAAWTDTDTLDGSDMLVFDSTHYAAAGQMQILGDITASIGVNANFFEGDGSRLTGVATSPGGGDTTIQFNDGGSTFAGTGSLVWNKNNNRLGINTSTPLVALDVHHSGTADPRSLSNNTGGGEVVYFGSSSAALQTGALYYLTPLGGWAPTSAVAVGSNGAPWGTGGGGHNQLLGIALGAQPSINGILTRGYFNNVAYLSGTLVKGGPVYVAGSGDANGAGNMDVAAPDAGNAFVRVVGYGTTTENVIYFNPSATYVEIASE